MDVKTLLRKRIKELQSLLIVENAVGTGRRKPQLEELERFNQHLYDIVCGNKPVKTVVMRQKGFVLIEGGKRH